MNRCVLFLVLAVAASIQPLLSADFRSAEWPFRKSVRIPTAQELYELPLDLEMQAASRADLLDLRVVGNDRVEPYSIETTGDALDVARINEPPGEIDAVSKSSVFVFDLGHARTFDHIEILIADKIYSRTARVEVGENGLHWTFAATGYVHRTFTESHTSVALGLQHARWVRLHLVNDDSIPLQVKGATFTVVRRTLQFVAHGPGPFWLYYGSPGTRPAWYDEAEIRAYREKGPPQQAQLGAAERNPGFKVNPLHEADQAYDRKMDDITQKIKWVGVGVIALFALLYVGYLVMENRPKRRHRRRRKRSTEESQTLSR